MSSNIYSSGISNVGSYQASGAPYLTGSTVDTSETTFTFPRVTKRIVVDNADSANDLYVYFSASSTTPFHLPAGKQLDMDVKCSHIYCKAVAGTVVTQIFAEITSIPTASMYSLAGLTGV